MLFRAVSWFYEIIVLQDLLYVVPFVAKILESCIDSKVSAVSCYLYNMIMYCS